jgi:hypothetical protein
LLVTGSILVQAPHVTIRHTRVAPSGGQYWVIRQLPGATDLLIEDVEIAGAGVHIGVNQEAAGLIVMRCTIHDVDTGVSLGGDRATVQDSHLSAVSTGVGAVGGNDTVAIRHNTITSLPHGDSAIGFAEKGPPVTGATIEDNVLAGGGYTFYAGAGGSAGQAIVMRHNRFSRAVYPKGGYYGPVAAWSATAPGNVWTGNVWDDTGAPVTP